MSRGGSGIGVLAMSLFDDLPPPLGLDLCLNFLFNHRQR